VQQFVALEQRRCIENTAKREVYSFKGVFEEVQKL
jgi:hypothetical protein